MEAFQTLGIVARLPNQTSIVARLDNDFIVLDMTQCFGTKSPFKLDFYGFTLCLEGSAEGLADLAPFRLTRGKMIVNMPDLLMEQHSISDDFHAIGIMMSRDFTRQLGLPYNFQLDRLVRSTPIVELDSMTIEAMTLFHHMLKELLATARPFQAETLTHLVCAFFYGMGSYIYTMPDKQTLSTEETIMQRFLDEVKSHYKSERKVTFYANRLNITPKYMSGIVRKVSGKTAAAWISAFVIEEACAMLKSTTLTAQQISYTLNFPSPTFFGKYFKRLTGMSPREYREKR